MYTFIYMLARLSDVNAWIQRFNFDEIHSLSLPLCPLMSHFFLSLLSFFSLLLSPVLPLYCIDLLFASETKEWMYNIHICDLMYQRAAESTIKNSLYQKWWECSTQILFFHTNQINNTNERTIERNWYWRCWWLY